MYEAQAHTIPMSSPSDVSGAEALFAAGDVDPAHVVALIAQTEGDGFARGYAAQCLQIMFARHLRMAIDEVATRVPMLMIGGTAGLMSPHMTLFVKRPVKRRKGSSGATGAKRLAIGVASTRVLMPEEYGTAAHARLVAEAASRACADAGIGSSEDVACIELKCPQMTDARMADAASRGQKVVHPDPAVASSRSRGASALGAAIALGEVDAEVVTDAAIGSRHDLFTLRGSASSGSEQDAVRVVVIGNAPGAPGDYVAACGVMEHQLDLAGARKAFAAAGLALEEGSLAPGDRAKLAALFVNAGADSLADYRGRRHTMLSDLLAHASGHVAKAVAHASVAGIVQDTLFLCSAGAEHQGRPGSNLICVIADHARVEGRRP